VLKHSTASNHHKLRYPSDLTDGECELIEPLIPPGKRGGGKRTVVMREVVNGLLMYILSTGCEWRAIPKDLPPKSTIYAGQIRITTQHGIWRALEAAIMRGLPRCRDTTLKSLPPSSRCKMTCCG
jgi:transposase